MEWREIVEDFTSQDEKRVERRIKKMLITYKPAMLSAIATYDLDYDRRNYIIYNAITDIYQKSFTNVEINNVGAYLSQIVKNKANTDFEKNKKNKTDYDSTLLENLENTLIDDTDEHIIHQENINKVLIAFEKLEAMCQKILKLNHFDGLSINEIAEICKINYEAAKKRIQRCTNKLRELY